MDFPDFARPKLTEPGVKYFLDRTLKQTHEVRMRFHNWVYNAALLVLFVGVVSAVLIYKYRGKPTEEEMRRKSQEQQEYILAKIKNFNQAKLHTQQALITGLPHWENEYAVNQHNQRVLF